MKTTSAIDIKGLEKTPENIWLLAETRSLRRQTYDALEELERILCILVRHPNDTGYSKRLHDGIDESKILLKNYENKLDKLYNIHPAGCGDMEKLRYDCNICKEKLVMAEKESMGVLPETLLGTPSPQVVDAVKSKTSTEEVPCGRPDGTSPTGSSLLLDSPSLGAQWEDFQKPHDAPEEQLESSIQSTEPEEVGGLSNFQLRVRHVLKVGRIKNMGRDPTMYGRILGSSTNKFIRFCADSGTPAAFIPRSVAERNKLEIIPPDPDEAQYASASGHSLTVIGQTSMYVKFKHMKNTRELRALVVEEEGQEVLVDLETLINWGIIPDCFPLPMDENEREVSRVRNVQKATPKKLVEVKERAGSWRTSIKFNQVTEEEYEAEHQMAVYKTLRNKLLKRVAHHPPAGTSGAAQTLFGSSQASSGGLLFPEEPRVNRILRLNTAEDRSCERKVKKHKSLEDRKLTKESLLNASDNDEYNLDGLFETDGHSQEDTLNLEELFARAETLDRCTVLETRQLYMEDEVKSHLENEPILTGGESMFNLELLFGAYSSPKVGGENGTDPDLDSESSFGTSISYHQAEFRDGKIERRGGAASEFDEETDQAAGDTCHRPGWVDLPQHTGVVVDLSKTTLQSSRRTPGKEYVNESDEDKTQMALEMNDTDKALPDEAGEPRSILRSTMWLVFMVALGTVLKGQEAEYTRHDLSMGAASSEAEFAKFDQSKNLKTEHILLNNSGKILPSSVAQTGTMELDPQEAAQKMTDMLAALMIMISSVILGLTIGLMFFFVWRYWREIRVLVSATVDLVYSVANIVRNMGQREVEHDNPFTEDENVGEDEDMGEEPDEGRGRPGRHAPPQARPRHYCGEIPCHEGVHDSSDADNAQLDMNDSSDSEDSTSVVVTDQAGKRYVVQELPRHIIVRPH